MNRRRFLELLGTAALGSGIVYSFPSVIVPKNISSEPISLTTCNNGLDKLFKMMDDDLKDAVKTMVSALNKQLYENSINVKLFDKFGFPNYINV
jgi:hypothetical protein